MDYRLLLLKYMTAVIANEGESFVSHMENDADFTKEELKELRVIENEADSYFEGDAS